VRQINGNKKISVELKSVYPHMSSQFEIKKIRYSGITRASKGIFAAENGFSKNSIILVIKSLSNLINEREILLKNY
jgi:hypothetical protein